MTIHPSSKPSTSTPQPDGPRPPARVTPIQIMGQSGTQDLTPLQRQRLDTAVMLLVNYLISISSRS